ncbi:MAG: hypothetical protein U1A78_09495 [Polyangia bacterium]
MVRRGYQKSLPSRVVQAAGSPTSPTLIAPSEVPDGLDDKQVADVCIGLPSAAGVMLRVLARTRRTLRAAVEQAGRLADELASESGETVVAPSRQPSAVHIADGTDGLSLWLDYDLGLRDGRPRVSRCLRLLVTVRFGADAVPPPPSQVSSSPLARSARSDRETV